MNEFGHVNTYARKPKAGKSGTAWSARQILGEAARNPDDCPHVENPLPPRVVAGCSPGELADRIDTLLEERKIEGKKKPRGDIHVLAAAVYSWPENVGYYNKERLENWMRDQIKWHAENVGTVDCAVLHIDESNPHIHVYTVDPDARRLTPGWLAKREAEKAGKTTKEANVDYRSAMVKFQDRLYFGVGQYHGLDRFGPKRQRLTRREHRDAKQERFEYGDRLRAIESDLENYDLCIAKKKAELAELEKRGDVLMNSYKEGLSYVQKIDEKAVAARRELQELTKQISDFNDKSGGGVTKKTVSPSSTFKPKMPGM